MAVLSNADRIAVWAKMMETMSRNSEACTINKTQLRAAVDAADQWADDNAASFNSALPVAARTNLTSNQKGRLLMLVIAKRFEVG
jgi:Ni2+-binding GTPase involved in maturation of urease and hydrogenase